MKTVKLTKSLKIRKTTENKTRCPKAGVRIQSGIRAGYGEGWARY